MSADADAGQASEQGQQEQQESQAPAGLDPNVQAFLDRLPAIDERLGRIDGWVQSQYEPEPEPDPMQGLDFDALGADPQMMRDALGQMLEHGDQRAMAQMAPLLQRIDSLETKLTASAIEAEIPALKDPQVAEAVVGQVVQWVRGMGLSSAEDMQRAARNPDLIKAAYALQARAQQAAAEVPAGGSPETPMEHGGGSPPPASEDDPAQRIVNARSSGGGWF